MLTDIQPGAPQDLEHLEEEFQELLLVLHVLEVEVPLSTSTHRLHQWSADMCWTHSFN